MVYFYNDEVVVFERVKFWWILGLIFLDIFLIIFIFKIIVLKYYEEGWYEVY